MLSIKKPTLIVNEQVCRNNILRMVQKASEQNIELRPHFKTHQSHAIGTWYREKGIKGITVSSFGMAEYFAEAGWNDITVAFPCNINEVDTVNELANKIELRILVSNDQIIKRLGDTLSSKVKVYIEIEEGGGRTGFDVNDIELIEHSIEEIEKSDYLEFYGLYCHAGRTYACQNAEEVKELSHAVLQSLSQLKVHLINKYGQIKLCYGDTPSFSILKEFNGVDEISAGNYVFYDVMQAELGSCSINDIAVALASPVVSIHYNKEEVCIYGGAVHLSKDKSMSSSFGKVAVRSNDDLKVIEGAIVDRVSQEHGMIKLPKKELDKICLGDVLYILPIHSCLTAENMGEYYSKSSTRLDHYAQKKRD